MRNALRVLGVLILCISLGGAALAVEIAADIEMSAYYGRAMNFLDQDDCSDEASFLRSEAYLYFSEELSESVYVVLSLVADFVWGHSSTEFDMGMEPSYYSDPTDLDVAIDTLYVDCPDVLGVEGLGVMLGRLYITKGDGWVFGDANPYGEVDLSEKGEWVQDPYDAFNVYYLAEDTGRLDIGFAKLGEAAPLQRGKGNDDLDVYWAYGEYRGVENHEIDVYGIWLHDSGVVTTPEQSIFAVGARAAGPLWEQLSYKGEVTFEFGEVTEDVDQSAFAGYVGLGYEWEQWNFDLGFTYFTGDDEADDENEVYNQLTTDMTFGQIMRGQGRANSLLGITPGWGIINLGMDVSPVEDWTLGLAGWYWMEMNTDYEDDLNIDLCLWEVNGYACYQMTDEVDVKLMAGVAALGEDEFGEGSELSSSHHHGLVHEYGAETDSAWFVRGSVGVKL